MPRYFFATEDGRCFPDQEGTQLQDEAAARAEAIRLLAGLLQDAAPNFWETRRLKLRVLDQAREELFSLKVDAAEVRS